MKVKDIKNKKFSFLLSAHGYERNKDGINVYKQEDLTLNNILFVLGKNYSKYIESLRNMTYHSAEQKEFKSHFPVWFVGGTFPYKKTHDNDIISYSNLIAIDIDACDNASMDLENLRQELLKLPYVIGVFKSISGLGIYALVLIDDGRKTKGCYKYLVNLWQQKFNIKIDESCSNVARKRFISYEDNIEKYIKDDEVDITPWKLEWVEPIKEEPIRPIIFHKNDFKRDDDLMIKRTNLAMKVLIDRGYSVKSYQQWWYVGCELANFSNGYEMFVKLSTNGKWQDNIDTINKKWKDCHATGITDELHTKWQGMAKNMLGANWWKETSLNF